MNKKYNIQLDVCTLCNLNCPACGSRLTSSNMDSIKAGMLKFDIFKKFIDENKDYINNIEISNSGEPTLNPELPEILEYAYINNITTSCSNGTNFNNVSDKLIHALVDYQVKFIDISIDGSSPEVYSKYRVGGDFNKVIENIKKVNEYKKEKNSEYPILFWKYIVRESTDDENEIINAIKYSKELNMEIKFDNTWEYDYFPKNPERISELTGLKFLKRADEKITSEKLLINKTPLLKTDNNFTETPVFQEIKDRNCVELPDDAIINKAKLIECSNFFLRKRLSINWDGKLLACCLNKLNPFDINVFEIGLKNLYKQPEIIKCYQYLTRKIENDNSCACMRCKEGKMFYHHKVFNRYKITPILDFLYLEENINK